MYVKQDKILNKMKIVFYLIIIYLFLFQCTDSNEPELNEFNVSINNSSNQTINCNFFNNNILISQYTLDVNSTNENCTYIDEIFHGYMLCFDSIVIVFPNNKGYINTSNSPNDNLSFDGNRHLFGNQDNGYSETFNNSFQFKITEEDYINAHDLP